jgi:hypothetical protein
MQGHLHPGQYKYTNTKAYSPRNGVLYPPKVGVGAGGQVCGVSLHPAGSIRLHLAQQRGAVLPGTVAPEGAPGDGKLSVIDVTLVHGEAQGSCAATDAGVRGGGGGVEPGVCVRVCV